MVPLRLRLKNFLSYREPPELVLEGVRVACISGNNGHGKSALLDAITWALWGCARGIAYPSPGHSIEELVHQGETEMMVALEFLSYRGGTPERYLVVRRVARGGRGRAPFQDLDLLVPSGDGWRSIREGTLDATQRKLLSLLGMDYRSFITSAFLLQGEADRFSRLTPAERKVLLAEVLGLSLFQRAAERAREEARARQAKAERLQADLETLAQALAEREPLERALAGARERRTALARQREERQKAVEEARHALQALEGMREEGARLRREVAQGYQDLRLLKEQEERARREVEEAQALLARREEIDRGYDRYREARRSLEEMDTLLARRSHLEAHRRDLERHLEGERRERESRLASLRERLESTRSLAGRLPDLEAEGEEVDEALRGLAEERSRLQEARRSLQDLRTEREMAEAEALRYRREAEEAYRSLSLLLQEREPRCPLCKTLLGPDARRHLEEELGGKARALEAQAGEQEHRARGLRREEEARAREIEEREERCAREERDLLTRQGRLSREMEEARRAREVLPLLEAEEAALLREMEEARWAPAVREELSQVEQALSRFPYDPDRHQALREEVRALEPFQQQAYALEQALRRLPEAQERWGALRSLLAQRHQETLRKEERLRDLERALQDYAVRREAVRSLEEGLSRLQREYEEAGEEVARLEERLAGLERKEAEKGEKEARLRALRREEAVYKELDRAFGKDGLQAWLIEEWAVPALEEWAVRLLHRLTEGRMGLRFLLQRPGRRGGEVQETLEVRVRDELGERSYELFSGGEAFRVDFALRLALAQLVAERSGAPIRTLFIDEGFGTQDAQGRQRLVEAIQAVQEEFDLILVITHMEELKEAFPVRIEVTKTEEGSTFQVVWS